MSSIRAALELTCSPAPTWPNAGACSNSWQSMPRARSASTLVMPPMPPPAMRTFRFRHALPSRTAECPGTAACPAWTCSRPSSAQRCSFGNTLPGLSRPLGVERAFEPLLLVEVVLGEHHRHQVALLDADAVLAGQHAADLDAELEDFGAELLGLLQLARLVGVVEDQRMQIAVAGVEHVGDAQPVVLRQFADALEHLRQLARAGWCRPCSSSPARCARPPGTPPCGRPRTARARLPSVDTRSVVERQSLAIAATRSIR